MKISLSTFQHYGVAILALTLYLTATSAQAVPSYARQTGMPCQSCHTVFPELTSFGRSFKLHGYTLTNLKQIKQPRSGNDSGLSLNKVPPIAAMLQVGFTRLNKTVPDTQNNDVQFPQQLSLFYAGEITPNIGSFIQITYDQESDQLNWDNTDIRYANTTTISGTSVVYGVTLNNGPTIQDLWNSTPAWGFPWSGSGSAPVPDAATLVDGGLAQDVAGLGAYAMWNDHLYTEVTLYRSAHLGSTQPGIGSENTISGASPYWRLAWQQYFGDNYLEIGTYGLYTKLIPNGVSGDTDDYTDIAFDAQYEHPLGNNLISMHANYIMEERDMNATLGTASPTYDIQTFRLDGNYHFGDRFVITAAYFNIDGDSNLTLNPFSRTGQPDSDGYVLQASYLPWQNVKFVAQYTGYNKFNGSSDNYDGSGRNASDNNTFYLNSWLMW